MIIYQSSPSKRANTVREKYKADSLKAFCRASMCLGVFSYEIHASTYL